MKNLVLSAILLLTCQIAQAQVELSANPIVLLFGAIQASVDINITEDWSVGGDVIAAEGGGGFFVSGRHYFNPKYGCDKFNVGTFVGGTGNEGDDTRVGLGFLIGYKVVSSKRVVLDIAVGGGRNFSDADFDRFLPYGKINLGYRFKTKPKE